MRTNVCLLFSSNVTIEPGAILQCDTTGKYYSCTFNDWRDAIHYLKWFDNNNYSNTDSSYNSWSNIYGYSEEDIFIGNLNEFQTNSSDDWIIWTSVGSINSQTNLNTISAWTLSLNDLNSELKN